MKNNIIHLVFLVVILNGCNSTNCADLKDEIKRLNKDLSERRKVSDNLKLIMLDANKSLSGIKTEQAEINKLLESPFALSNKAVILKKIKAMKRYTIESRNKIEALEVQLQQAQAKGQETDALRMMVAQLRQQIIEKDRKISILQNKVENLENNITALKTEISNKDEIITTQEDLIRNKNKEVKNAQKQLRIEEKNQVAIEINNKIQNIIKEGEIFETKADGFSKITTKQSEKINAYVSAYNKYKEALQVYNRNIGNVGALNFSRSGIEQKMREVKSKAPRKAQRQMN